MTDRCQWVDNAKAVGIVLVVLGHVIRGMHSAGLPMDPQLFRLADSIIYSFHMPLFFFLSGLFFYSSLQKYGTGGLLTRKIDTIVWPYLLWSILQGMVEASLSRYTNGNVTYGEVFSLLWQPRAQFWFLYALFMIFVVASLIFRRLPARAILPVFLLAALVYMVQSHLYRNMFLYFITNNLVYFVFGMLAIRWEHFEKLASWKSLLVTAFCFVVVEFEFHFVQGKAYGNKGPESLIVALTAIVFIVSLAMNMTRKPIKWIIHIGTSSMAIYVMHILAASGLRIVLEKCCGIDSIALHTILGTVVGVALPLIAVYIIDRWRLTFFMSLPISKMLRKIGVGNRN